MDFQILCSKSLSAFEVVRKGENTVFDKNSGVTYANYLSRILLRLIVENKWINLLQFTTKPKYK